MSDRPENSSVAAGLPSTAPIERNSSGSILPKPDDFKALLFYLAGVALLSVMDATIKDVAGRYPTPEVGFMRNVSGLVVISVICAILRPGWATRQMLFVNGIRSGLTAVLALTFFFSLAALPLAEAVALSFLSPTFLALFGAWLLKERLSPRIGVSLGVGFLGVLIIVSGQIGGRSYGPWALAGAACAFASAVIYALSMVLLKSRARTDPIPLIVLVLHLGTTLILLVPALLVWKVPPPRDLLVFSATGLLGVGGHLFLANAFARSQAARLAPFEYTALIWAAGIGYAVFGEVPGWATILGAVFIVASAIIANRA